MDANNAGRSVVVEVIMGLPIVCCDLEFVLLGISTWLKLTLALYYNSIGFLSQLVHSVVVFGGVTMDFQQNPFWFLGFAL